LTEEVICCRVVICWSSFISCGGALMDLWILVEPRHDCEIVFLVTGKF